jgi:hypothetical protein
MSAKSVSRVTKTRPSFWQTAARLESGEPSQALLKNSSGIIASLAQQVGYINRQIFIHLEGHRIVYAGKATTRSRARSAAYARAACTASRLKEG